MTRKSFWVIGIVLFLIVATTIAIWIIPDNQEEIVRGITMILMGILSLAGLGIFSLLHASGRKIAAFWWFLFMIVVLLIWAGGYALLSSI